VLEEYKLCLEADASNYMVCVSLF